MTSLEVINAPTWGRANRGFVRKVKMTLFALRRVKNHSWTFYDIVKIRVER